VGGVVFENQVEFADMFRSAEQRMAGVQDGAAFELTHLHS
ncbi:GGDEF domain-containing protein, partial [Mesorhizobium sp. M7A.F.Ca.CA.002.15.1.1]